MEDIVKGWWSIVVFIVVSSIAAYATDSGYDTVHAPHASPLRTVVNSTLLVVTVIILIVVCALAFILRHIYRARKE